MATYYYKETTVAWIFKIGISWNTKCDKLVCFPNSGHLCPIVLLFHQVFQVHMLTILLTIKRDLLSAVSTIIFCYTPNGDFQQGDISGR